ncbi:hypothetical protein BK133_04975 [Paenibacillus sp. FSL H8-0548]|uniref:YceD family protein n=1 Tax=Paenibacillus sp. FSL H8-0548 TaxID=1920422 RepID=UPI00096F9C49|nr:DUF177 domain-containing protein [Paenibacillus sp. FSL H8-0548]OMF37411.1 hypothetical protein BK133_04975 [Paenibacillus sp. FSL H8-0548]
MQFHIQETMSKGLKTTVDEELDVSDLFKGRQDVYRTGPLRVSLQVAGHESFIEVDGRLSIDFELACARCLDPVKDHTVIHFSEMFKLPTSDADRNDDMEEEESDFIEVDAERLDLRPYVEEALQLFMPFAPLCSNDCKGLCPTCGQNLNEHKCDCPTEKIDIRFEALKDLFKE